MANTKRNKLESLLDKTKTKAKKALALTSLIGTGIGALTNPVYTPKANAEVLLEMDTYLLNGFPTRAVGTNTGATLALVVRADAKTEKNQISKMKWSVKAPGDIAFLGSQQPIPYVNNPDFNATETNDFFYPLKMYAYENHSGLSDNERTLGFPLTKQDGSSASLINTNQSGVLGVYFFHVGQTNNIGNRTFEVNNTEAYDIFGNKVESSGSKIGIKIVGDAVAELNNRSINFIDLVKMPGKDCHVPRVYSDTLTKSNVTLKVSSDLKNWKTLTNSVPNPKWASYNLPIDFTDYGATNRPRSFYKVE